MPTVMKGVLVNPLVYVVAVPVVGSLTLPAGLAHVPPVIWTWSEPVPPPEYVVEADVVVSVMLSFGKFQPATVILNCRKLGPKTPVTIPWPTPFVTVSPMLKLVALASVTNVRGTEETKPVAPAP